MTQIGLESLKGKTVGEIINMANSLQDFPVEFKMAYLKAEENSYAERLVEDLGK